MRNGLVWLLATAASLWLAGGQRALGVPDLLLPENLKTMGCGAPDTKLMFVRASQTGNVFYPGDSVDLTIKVTRGKEPLKSVTLEIIEIAARQNRYLKGWSVMSEPVAIENLGPRGKLDVPVAVEDKEGAMAEVEAKGLPVPPRYGTYAVTIAPNGENPQFLCTLLRAMKPQQGFDIDAPVFGEGQFLTHDSQKPEHIRARALTLGRLGIRGVRIELGWAESKQGTYDWGRFDPLMNGLAEAKIKALVTMGGHPYWTYPLGQPTPACIPEKPDHSCQPKHYEAFGKWIYAFCDRYWQRGNGALWAIEHWNEPWEGISISGWESDSNHYRALMKQIADNARRVSRRIKTAAACSIMNTEDKFLVGEDRKELAKLVDIFTDHYVPPRTSYGPMVAKYWGKESTDTETWIAASEVLLPQIVTQFLACGQDRMTPWHPAMTYFSVPGSPMTFQMPNPVALASNVFNVMMTGRKFERMLFHTHLPWAFQFGTGRDATVVLFGKLYAPHGGDPKDVLWWQLQAHEGGTITIDNSDGRLEFYDIAGNREFESRKCVVLPMDYLSHYIRSPRGGIRLIEQRLKDARIEGMRPVEIILHDFTAPFDPLSPTVGVTVHNLLNRRIQGVLKITPPPGFTLSFPRFPCAMDAGATVRRALAATQAKVSPTNTYLFSCEFDSDAGKATWAENLNVVVAKRGTKKVDGDLADWKDDLGVLADAKLQKVDPTQQAWMPFLQAKDAQPDGAFAEVKLAWDDAFLYVAARVLDQSDYPGHQRLETWDEEQYFRSAKDDGICERLRPYRRFVLANMRDAKTAEKMKADPEWPAYQKLIEGDPELKHAITSNAASVYFQAKDRNPKATFADAYYVYKKVPWGEQPWAGDNLQLGFDFLPDYHYNMKLDTDKVPWGFHAMPDTDYEFSAYQCLDGKSELWRILAPGMPRTHHYPRQPRAKFDQGPVNGARHIVKREGKVTTYELAIPWSEFAVPPSGGLVKPKPGATFGFTFRVNNNDKPDILYGAEKSATKSNGLSLHPYWETKPSCGIRWALGE
ncbi:MAG: hypothetical protein FJ290_10320 [Planctomycetes bacterium]|nr:hypothetical protein [Planctomycetota bacterium]